MTLKGSLAGWGGPSNWLQEALRRIQVVHAFAVLPAFLLEVMQTMPGMFKEGMLSGRRGGDRNSVIAPYTIPPQFKGMGLV